MTREKYKKALMKLVKQAGNLKRDNKFTKSYQKLADDFFGLIPDPIVKLSLLNFEERGFWMAFYWELLYNTQEGTIADGIKFGFYLDSIQRAVDTLHQVQLFKLVEIKEHEIDSIVGMREFLKQYHEPYMKYLARVEEKFKKEYIDKLIKETNMLTGEVKFLWASDKLIKTMDYKFEDNGKYLNYEIKKMY